jgi:hypothetical protein
MESNNGNLLYPWLAILPLLQNIRRIPKYLSRLKSPLQFKLPMQPFNRAHQITIYLSKSPFFFDLGACSPNPLLIPRSNGGSPTGQYNLLFIILVVCSTSNWESAKTKNMTKARPHMTTIGDAIQVRYWFLNFFGILFWTLTAYIFYDGCIKWTRL